MQILNDLGVDLKTAVVGRYKLNSFSVTKHCKLTGISIASVTVRLLMLQGRIFSRPSMIGLGR